ncbi:MAG: hypothetical protein Q8M02_14860 [Candidatus Didemnitutus sp.]|nr:hypothetical protein [Candidatus Didemnitutus sp.]
MKPTDSLSSLLQRWHHAPAPAPEFTVGVWSRIEASRGERLQSAFFRWALPLAASVALLLGVSVARIEAKREHADTMAAYYMRTIDPVQITAPATLRP